MTTNRLCVPGARWAICATAVAVRWLISFMEALMKKTQVSLSDIFVIQICGVDTGAIFTMRPSFFILEIKPEMTLSDEAITISWLRRVLFSINGTFTAQNIVKSSRIQPVFG